MMWQDLIRMAYREGEHDPTTGYLDCLGASREGLRRLGMPEAADWLPATPAEAEALIERLRDGADEHWERIGASHRDATEVGDVIVGRAPGRSGARHIAVLVELARRLVLTAHEGRGVCLYPVHRYSGLRGVYRFRNGVG